MISNPANTSDELVKDCIFCRIIRGELPCYKIHENQNYLAFLDIFPRNTGQAVIVPKKHLPSKLTDNDKENILNLTSFAIDVAKKIENKIPEVERCQFVIEGFQLNHLHVKLYPAYFPEPNVHSITESGERAVDEELQKLATVINN